MISKANEILLIIRGNRKRFSDFKSLEEQKSQLEPHVGE